MITFGQARGIVEAAERGNTTPDYVILDHGFEDDESYQVLAGPARAFDPATPIGDMPLDILTRLVDKATGEITYVNPVEILDRLRKMTPVQS